MEFDKFRTYQYELEYDKFDGKPFNIGYLVCKNLNFLLQIESVCGMKSKPLKFTLTMVDKAYGYHVMVCNIHVSYPHNFRKFFDVSICGNFIPSNNKFSVVAKKSIRELVDEKWLVDRKLKMTITISSSPQIHNNIGIIKDPPKVDNIIKIILSPHSVKDNLRLEKNDLNWLCSAASSLLLSQPSLLFLKAPIVCVADLHGRYIDLLRIFRRYGFPDRTNFLFLGDYVDRGDDSLDILTLLLALKLKFPENIYLLRGNHECELISTQYGFRDECQAKNCPYYPFVLIFDSLPLAAVINQKIFCVHGGLSPTINSLEDIKRFQRPSELPKEGIINDLAWSDPSGDTKYFGRSVRNTSSTYGRKSVKKFMKSFGFDMILRAHEVVPNGFKFPFGRKAHVITLFSAPNYYQDNLGATILFNEDLSYSIDSFKDSTQREAEEIMATDFNTMINL